MACWKNTPTSARLGTRAFTGKKRSICATLYCHVFVPFIQSCFRSRSSVYVIAEEFEGYVKIGFTKRTHTTRFKEIERQDRQNLDQNFVPLLMEISLVEAERLEKLVHADLAYFQCDYFTTTGRPSNRRKEYFNIDLATAARKIHFWWRVMQKIGIKPGKCLDADICTAIQATLLLNPQMTDRGSEPVEPKD